MEFNLDHFADFVMKNHIDLGKLEIEKAKTDDLTKLPTVLTERNLRRAISWCRDKNIYVIHNIVKNVTNTSELEFIFSDKEHYIEQDLLNSENETWLHVAVANGKSDKILEYLIEKLNVNVGKKDKHNFTALHWACSRGISMSEKLYKMLISNGNGLVITESNDGVTPLELACVDVEKLKTIQNVEKGNLIDLLSHIDKLSCRDKIKETHSTCAVWIKILHHFDKYQLRDYMKNCLYLKDKYYLSPKDFNDVIYKCHENGQGILTYIKTQCMNDQVNVKYKNLFTKLSGLRVNKFEKQNERLYYKSGVFLALITGRLDLVPQLLAFCQFNIILYGLFTCLICHKLLTVKDFPDQVLENINKVINESEKYSIAVLYRTSMKDLTENKGIINGFLIEKDLSTNQMILDIAYLAKCYKFLSLPCCQQSLTKLWNNKKPNCPSVKFYLHSLFHLIFLLLFSCVLINELLAKFSVIETLCYVYGTGYLFEEIRQIFGLYHVGFINYYIKDPTSYLDITSILLLMASFFFRLFYPIPASVDNQDVYHLKETRNKNLFVTRLLLCCTYIFFFIRVIYFGFIFEQLGPKLKMIGKMIITDLMPVIFIFVVFIVSFGISFEALLFSNGFYIFKSTRTSERKSAAVLISDIFRRATFTIFDSHFCLEEIENQESDVILNTQGKSALYFLVLIYIVIVNIMLMNLLIAIFSNTVTVIMQKSHESWKASRYKKVKEYLHRSLLPPPLNIIEIPFEIILYIIKRIRKQFQSDTSDNDQYITQNMPYKILQALCLKDCRYKLIQTGEDKENERKSCIMKLQNDLNTIKESVPKIMEGLKRMEEKKQEGIN